jgi:hypothetical protein
MEVLTSISVAVTFRSGTLVLLKEKRMVLVTGLPVPYPYLPATMSGVDAQLQASQLNLKLENSAKEVLDEIDKRHIRRIGKQTHTCIVGCYNQAGQTQPAESLEHCSRQCQQSHLQANNIVQEVSVSGRPSNDYSCL